MRARKNPHGTSGAGPKLAPQRTSAFILPSCLGFSLVLPHKLLKLLRITGLIVGDTHRAGNAGPSHFSGDELPEPASELCPPPRVGQINLHLEDGLPQSGILFGFQIPQERPHFLEGIRTDCHRFAGRDLLQ